MFWALNDDPGSETGIYPTTFVFGVYLIIPGGGSRVIIIQRAIVIQDYTNIFIRMKGRRTVFEKVEVLTTPVAKRIQNVREFSLGHNVLLCHDNIEWRHYRLVRVQENDVDNFCKVGNFHVVIKPVRLIYTKDSSEPHNQNLTDKISNHEGDPPPNIRRHQTRDSFTDWESQDPLFHPQTKYGSHHLSSYVFFVSSKDNDYHSSFWKEKSRRLIIVPVFRSSTQNKTRDIPSIVVIS